jgi:hypothetical protein
MLVSQPANKIFCDGKVEDTEKASLYSIRYAVPIGINL